MTMICASSYTILINLLWNCVRGFVFRDLYDHTGAEFEIVLRHIFVIDAYAATGEDCFCLRAADAVETLHDKGKKRFGLFHFEDRKLWLARIVHRERR